jgi:predicted MPP superfamily phosphohydrolase
MVIFVIVNLNVISRFGIIWNMRSRHLFLTLSVCIMLLPGSALLLPTDGISPTQLRLSWTGPPETSMTIMWQTAQPTESSVVEYGTTEALGQRAVGKRVTYEYATGVLHEVSLEGLQPDTRYFYRAGDPAAGFSSVSSFTSAPAAPREFVFTAFGDHGVGKISKVNVERVLAEKPAFHLILGDLSYADGKQKVWDKWFEQLEPLSRAIPVMPTLGNHDYAGKHAGYAPYLARLALPPPETYYSFDYSSARFVTFNSDDFKNPEQMAWFVDRLKKSREDKNVRWVIVYQHHPLYSSNAGRLNNKPLIEATRKIYDQFKVDLVLAGHNHNYERSYPLVGDRVAQKGSGPYKKGNGVVFVISGGGGKSAYEFTPETPAVTARRESVPHYLRVRVSEKELRIEALRTEDRGILDSFRIVSGD